MVCVFFGSLWVGVSYLGESYVKLCKWRYLGGKQCSSLNSTIIFFTHGYPPRWRTLDPIREKKQNTDCDTNLIYSVQNMELRHMMHQGPKRLSHKLTLWKEKLENGGSFFGGVKNLTISPFTLVKSRRDKWFNSPSSSRSAKLDVSRLKVRLGLGLFRPQKLMQLSNFCRNKLSPIADDLFSIFMSANWPDPGR